MDCFNRGECFTRFFYKHTLFLAQLGVAYREAVFEPQVCLDVYLTNRTFVYEITQKSSVKYNKAMYMNRGENIEGYFFF